MALDDERVSGTDTELLPDSTTPPMVCTSVASVMLTPEEGVGVLCTAASDFDVEYVGTDASVLVLTIVLPVESTAPVRLATRTTVDLPEVDTPMEAPRSLMKVHAPPSYVTATHSGLSEHWSEHSVKSVPALVVELLLLVGK